VAAAAAALTTATPAAASIAALTAVAPAAAAAATLTAATPATAAGALAAATPAVATTGILSSSPCTDPIANITASTAAPGAATEPGAAANVLLQRRLQRRVLGCNGMHP
jgi:hypothetical protein